MYLFPPSGALHRGSPSVEHWPQREKLHSNVAMYQIPASGDVQARNMPDKIRMCLPCARAHALGKRVDTHQISVGHMYFRLPSELVKRSECVTRSRAHRPRKITIKVGGEGSQVSRLHYAAAPSHYPGLPRGPSCCRAAPLTYP